MYKMIVILCLIVYGTGLVSPQELKCGPNEIPSNCSTPCPATCNEPNKTCKLLICNKGCVCKSGCVRESDGGPCIFENDCKKCNPNQIWQNCSDNACKKTCENRNESLVCPTVCLPGCSCQKDYVWNKNLSYCVPVSSCPTECGENQIWEQCSDNKCKRTCATKNETLGCPKICIPGCSCKEDYVWNTDLTECIPIYACPEDCCINQYWDECSDIPCRRTCENRNISQICPKRCFPGCMCKPGYVWDDESISCISEDLCPKHCGDNQIWEPCSDNACKKTCENKDLNQPCPAVCIEGCSCKPGYVWNQNLTECIPDCECPEKCGPNQIWESCSDNSCRKTCQNRNGPKACTYDCRPGCSCKTGFVWNEDYSECIPIQRCPPQCGDNQVWEQCSDNLCKRTCDNNDDVVPCPLICQAGCSCKDGFVWNGNLTKCIAVDECPKGCGPNQVKVQCSDNACKRTCDNKDRNIICPAICIEGCSCKPGFVWNEDLTQCIPSDSCPKDCDINQVWEQCSDNACKKTCENRNKSMACPLICVPGCSCKNGTVWNEELTKCIPVQDCPLDCGPHQKWETCSDVLCRKTCEHIDGPQPCPRACIPGCSCEDGYVWNEDISECIPKEKCHGVCGAHQHWELCSDENCKRNCKNMNDDNFVCNRACIPGCSCNPGFVWNEEGTKCISACECENHDCGDRGEWSTCAHYKCRPTCQHQEKRPCHDCVPGCVCKEGYIWDENIKKCVDPNECTPVCRENEVYEVCSDNNCRTTCKNMNSTVPPKCDKRCLPGCSCAPGFVWNEFEKRCVCPEDCPKVCKENEEWSYCTSGCQRTCQGPSASVCLTVCIPGCQCIEGYLFDKFQDKCVLQCNCSHKCDDNKQWCEYASSLPVTCQNVLYPQCQSIDEFNVTIFPGCICPSGTILDEHSNKCISLNQCIKLLKN